MKRLIGAVAAVALLATGALGGYALAGPGPAKGTPGDLWSVGHFGGNDNISNPLGVDIGTLSLPAGTFLIQAKVTVQNHSNGDSFDCWLHNSGGTLDESGGETPAAFKLEQLPLLVTYSQSAPDVVQLRCSGLTANAFAKDWTLAAIKIHKLR